LGVIDSRISEFGDNGLEGTDLVDIDMQVGKVLGRKMLINDLLQLT